MLCEISSLLPLLKSRKLTSKDRARSWELVAAMKGLTMGRRKIWYGKVMVMGQGRRRERVRMEGKDGSGNSLMDKDESKNK